MLWIHSLFNYSRSKPRPWVTGVYNPTTNKRVIFPVWLPKPPIKLEVADNRQNSIKKLLVDNNEDIVINDFKTHIDVLELSYDSDYRVSESMIDGIAIQDMTLDQATTIINKVFDAGIDLQPWRKLIADSQIVYAFLQSQGVYNGVDTLHPHYTVNTYSGRSKTTGYNIQGSTDEDIIMHINPQNSVLIHFDWIAADLRAISILSNDEHMASAFKDSDPYTIMAAELEVERDICKQPFLQAIYSMSYEDKILEYYPKVKEWMRSCSNFISKNGYLESILNRKFQISKDRTDKSVFNATIQGSVAHAMHNSLYRIYKKYNGSYLLTETHDAIVMACPINMAKSVINDVSNIMLHPFDGILDSNPRFPLKISVGTEWRNWKKFKEVR